MMMMMMMMMYTSVCVCVCVWPYSVSVPDTWIQYSETNIRRSQNERAASRDIRAQIDQLVQSVMASIANEWNAVNSAFSDRIAEYIDARNKIQAHLAKVTHRRICNTLIGVDPVRVRRSGPSQ